MPGWPRWRSRRRAAGFSGFGFTDHPAPTQRWLETGGHDALDPFVAMGFAAAHTTTLRLIPNIVVLPYRNPFVVAKAGATLDLLSGGRFTLAVGVGYLKREFAALGVDFDERGQLLEEALEVIRAMWTTDDVSYEGRHFSAKGITAHPRPVSTRIRRSGSAATPAPPAGASPSSVTAGARSRRRRCWLRQPVPRRWSRCRTSRPVSTTCAGAATTRAGTLGAWTSRTPTPPAATPASDDFNADAYLDGCREACRGWRHVGAGQVPGDSLAHAWRRSNSSVVSSSTPPEVAYHPYVVVVLCRLGMPGLINADTINTIDPDTTAGDWVRRLNGVDALLLYSEAPEIHMHTLKVGVIDVSGLDADFTFEFFQRVAGERLQALKPLRYQLVGTPSSPSFVSGRVISRSSVPVVRSRSIVIDVTTNIAMKGKSPRQRCADAVEDARLVDEEPVEQGDEHDRDEQQQRDRAGVAADLQEHASAGGHGTAHAIAPVSTSRRKALVHRLAAGAGSDLGGRPTVEEPPAADEQELVAALGLVHDVARDEERRPVGRKPRERRPEVAPQERVEADRRLVENEQLGPSDERRRERDAGALAAREPAHDTAGIVAEADQLDDLVRLRVGRPDQAGEVPDVLSDREVVVDGRALRRVRDAPA